MAVVGMDLGTTHSLVAHWSGEAPRLIPNALGEVLTPSAVSLDNEGAILVGRPARERLQTHPDVTVANFKRAMGTRTQFTLGKRSFRPEELSALVLSSLKADAEAALGEPVTGVVITVPAYFNDAQRQATRVAGQLAGLEVHRLINEPTAAAIAYGVHERPEFSTSLVLDLGGGTFDVSVLEMFEGVMQVHSSAGDNHLGGEDFVGAMVGHFLEQHDIDPASLAPEERSDLLAAAERCKQALSGAQEAPMAVNLKGAPLTLEWTRERFEGVTTRLFERVRGPVALALRDADLTPADLDTVILVGGASRMPAMRSLAAQMLGRLPFVHVNPDEVVALGAAVQVGLMNGDGALAEMVLTDVAPYSLGIGTYNANATQKDDDLFSPIIERNTPVPVSRVEQYCTVADGQHLIVVDVFQGESRRVQENIKLGTLTVPVPRGPAGEEAVDVRFTYDINGLLEVEVTVVSTERSQAVVIQREDEPLSEAEVKKRLHELAHLKQHPRDDLVNAALLARAERLYQERLGETRQELLKLIGQFEAELATQDHRRIAAARERFEVILDAIEGDSPF